jgi:excisionase family DNA binding protein
VPTPKHPLQHLPARRHRARRQLALPEGWQNMTLPELLLALPVRTLKAHELAPLLGVAPLTLYRRAQAGEIPSYRLGGSVVFDTVAISRHLASQTQ